MDDKEDEDSKKRHMRDFHDMYTISISPRLKKRKRAQTEIKDDVASNGDKTGYSSVDCDDVKRDDTKKNGVVLKKPDVVDVATDMCVEVDGDNSDKEMLDLLQLEKVCFEEQRYFDRIREVTVQEHIHNICLLYTR